MQVESMPTCPNCGQSDAVRPLSQAAAGAPSEIAQQLQPPVVAPTPQKTDFTASKYRQQSAVTKNGVGSKVDLGLGILWLILVAITFFLLARIDADLIECVGTGVAVALIFVVYGIRQLVLKNLPIPSLQEYYRRDEAEDKEAEQRAQQAFNEALASHQAQQETAAKWGNMLYCARCNGAFDPQQRVFIPAANLHNYLEPKPQTGGVSN